MQSSYEHHGKKLVEEVFLGKSQGCEKEKPSLARVIAQAILICSPLLIDYLGIGAYMSSNEYREGREAIRIAEKNRLTEDQIKEIQAIELEYNLLHKKGRYENTPDDLMSFE